MKKFLWKLIGLLSVATPFMMAAAPLSAIAAGNNWLSSFSGNLYISQLSIPGTHESGAQYEPVPGTAKCQNLSIGDQLNAGARFLDIRCRHLNNAFVIHHGSVYENMNFDDVLNATIGFLNSNPTECVIMSVKEEYTASGDTRSFEATFDSYVAENPGKWYLGSGIPTLGQARGKIVLLRRFAASTLPTGIDASVWPDNTSFTTDGGLLQVQDWYNVTDNNTKWNDIVTLLNAAYSGGSGTLYINFSSGVQSGLFGIPNIPAVSNDINSRLSNYFTANTLGRYGIIAMDFADAAKCTLIYSTIPNVNGYAYAGGENATANFSTPVDLAYGAKNSYSYLYSQTGNVTFNNATFGDPAPGVVKAGYYNPFMQCAGELGSAAFTVPVEAAYGANGSYFYKQGISGTVGFNPTSFGGDPDPGVVKAGYYMPYAQCAGEGGSSTFSSPTDVAYGANGQYYFLYAVTGTISFNPATFGGDPDYGVVKAGYFRPTGPLPLHGVANGSFETPSVGAGGCQYDPTGAIWTFSGDSGIQSNGSAWAAPTAPNGTQTAFLQIYNGGSNGSMSQTVNFNSAGTYKLTFKSALRASPHNGTISFNVLVDGTVVGTFSPTSTTSFTSYATNPFTLSTAGNHTVAFTAVGNASDSSVFIDAVGM
jgi:1-phosphatidylinositol phosphodiesterase